MNRSAPSVFAKRNPVSATFEIVDGLVDVYNADRVRWLGENLNRGLVESDHASGQENIFELIGLAQYEVINDMAYQLLDYIDENKKEEQ